MSNPYNMLRPVTLGSLALMTCSAWLGAGCGKASLEPVGAGESGGAAGNGGSSGSAGAGSSTSGGSGGSSGIGGSGGSSGSAGTGSCSTPNPAGCLQSGCDEGVCDTPAGECFPSECVCEEGEWSCTARNCGDFTFVPACVPAQYHVRVGYVQGQSATADFCVAYQDDSGEQPAWESVGLMQANGYQARQFEGLDKLSRYLPLKQRPLYFTKTSTSCADGGPAISVPDGPRYFTFLSVPYSGEADTLWVLPEVEPHPLDPGFGGTQLRIQNATFRAENISASAGYAGAEQQDLGTAVFGASTTFTPSLEDHLHTLTLNDGHDGPPPVLNWVHIDLLALYNTTIFISGDPDVGYRGLGCIGSNPILEGSDYSNCLLLDAE